MRTRDDSRVVDEVWVVHWVDADGEPHSSEFASRSAADTYCARIVRAPAAADRSITDHLQSDERETRAMVRIAQLAGDPVEMKRLLDLALAHGSAR